MKELNLTHKIAFALLCAAAFTNTFTVVAHVTLVRLVLPIVLCILLFTERVRLDSSFYVVCSFFLAYITYTLLVTLAYGRAVAFPDTISFCPTAEGSRAETSIIIRQRRFIRTSEPYLVREPRRSMAQRKPIQEVDLS